MKYQIQWLSALWFTIIFATSCSGESPREQCAAGCLIDSICHESGTVNRENVCQRCDPERSADAWSDNVDTSCDDGLYCTVDDTCSAGECLGTPRNCSDEIDCNGEETCQEDELSCRPGELQCSSQEFCDMLTGDCVFACPGCVIDSMCYGDGQLNPANPCQHCDVESSTDSWTDNDGARCDDELFCTFDDTCTAGVCSGSPRNCADHVECNGTESCDEAADLCLPGEPTCEEDELCDQRIDACVTTCTGCVIDGSCYGNGQLNPTNPCQHCDIGRSIDSWSDNDGARCDDELFCTVEDTCSAGVCAGTDRSCADDVDCNGTETCDDTADICRPGVPTCDGDALCDPLTDSCVTTCTGCVIGGACYGDGQLNPTNPCQHCDVERSTDSWSDNDGARCDDEVYCTIDDTCSAGECRGIARSCDDGVGCNGTESCDEATDACLPGVTLCDDGELCDLRTDSCVTTCTGCVIDGACHGNGQLNPTNPCQHCDVDRSTDSWSDNDGARCDDETFCTIADTCLAGECRGTTRSCDDGVVCNGTESCDEAANRCLPGVSTCDDDQLCDQRTDICVTTCTGCVIDGACYGKGQLNPTNTCEHCDENRSTDSWSNNDGASCDDDVFCNGRDTCLAGECVVHTNDACPDDTLFCNGDEICNEETDSCEHRGYPCPSDDLYCNGVEICNEATESCDHSGDPCPADASFCNGTEICNEETDVCEHTGNPCTNDDFYCNGVETCSEAIGGCLSSGNPCADGEECYEAEERCCEREHSIGCHARNVVWFDSCGRLGDVIEECLTGHESCVEDACVCGSPWSGDDCDRCVIHVNGSDGDDSNDGTSWMAALETVNAALTIAEPDCEIWVAQGIYYPTDDSTFRLVAHVGLYGGFVGSEQSRSERNVDAYQTVLSGDVDRNGLLDTGNIPHVVTGVDDAIIDGFTITGGYARGPEYPNNAGGGMFNESSSPTVANCNFTVNSAYWGGGMLNIDSSPTVTDCTFSDNIVESGGGGGMLNWYSSSPTVKNCAFTSNSAEWGGGMLNWHSSSPTVTDCTFSDNDAVYGGGIENAQLSSPTVSDCAFTGNNSIELGGGMCNNNASSPSVTGSTFSRNIAAIGGGMYNSESSPTVTDCIFSDNSADDGGGMYNSETSPTVTSCIFTGNSADFGSGGGIYNTNSALWATSCTYSGNSAVYHGGGIYHDSLSATVIGCTFWNNTAGGDGGGLQTGNSYLEIRNSTLVNNRADGGGGGLLCVNAECSITNSILWGNEAARYLQLAMIDIRGLSEVSFCDIEGGWGGGSSIIEFDPLFQDVASGNLRLSAGSPCIDFGSNADLPIDMADLDSDGDTSETLPLDIDGNPRVTDGNGDGTATVDIGAYEF